MGRPQRDGVEHFIHIPWCKELLSHRSTTTFTPSHRRNADINGNIRSQDQLLRQSLSTSSTIPHCVALYQNPKLLEPSNRPASATWASGQQRFLINEVILLFDLQPGVNGYQGTAHDGLMSTLLSEAMGNLIYIHNSVDSSLRGLGQTIASNVLNLAGKVVMPARLSVEYLKPLKTPQVVAVVASLSRIEAQSILAIGRIQNDNGDVFATSQGQWNTIQIRSTL